MPKITKRFVETIIPESEKTLKYWDAELKGFGLVVLPSGRRTYCVEYRNTDRIKKRMKIGIHGKITTEEARELAKKQLALVAHGVDPAMRRQAMKELPTIGDLARDYFERHGHKKRLKSVKEDQKLLKNIILPALEKQKVFNVTRRDIESLHKDLHKTPYQANRVISLLSKMFSLAVSWNWRTDNPVLGIEKYQEEKRDYNAPQKVEQ